MAQPIMVGCDLHDKTMLLKIAQGRGPAETMSVQNTGGGRRRMIAQLQARAADAGGAEVILAYEASGQGFGLYDELLAAGIKCHVLAPTKIVRSIQQKRKKTDEKDAQGLLELLRGHVLAGNALPKVWIPDMQTRDDRELVRMRLDVAEKQTAVKAQVKGLLKRHRLVRPEAAGKGWTNGFKRWLHVLTSDSALAPRMRQTLASLLRQLDFIEQELDRLDAQLRELVDDPRYQAAVVKLVRLQGVGVLTALVFLTEVGDARRFANRRQISAYLGLVPACQESGTQSDRKGHITRQGPSRVRRVLCQATWARVRCEGDDQRAYLRIVEKNPKKKKVAVVAAMRRLAVRMWHQAREATAEATCSPGGPPAACSAPAG